MILKVSSNGHDTYIRKIYIGENNSVTGVTFGPGSYLTSGTLEYGNLDCHVLIGRYSSLAHRIKFLVGFNHNGLEVTTYPFRDIAIDDGMNHSYEANQYQIIIGNDVWIGADVTILGGVQIGNGAIIASNSVVTKNVPAYAMVAGNPAKIKKYRFPNDIIDKLQKIKWWNWPEKNIKNALNYMKSPQLFIENFYPSSVYTPDSSIIHDLQILRNNKRITYAFVADFEATTSLWEKVLNQYLEFHRGRSDTLLMFAAITQEEYNQHMNSVQAILDKFPSHPPVALIGGISTALPEFISAADILITTREDISSQCVDFTAGQDIKILFGNNHIIFGKYMEEISP